VAKQMPEDGSLRASRPDAYTPWYTIWCGVFLLLIFVARWCLDRNPNPATVFTLVVLPLLVLAGTLVISLAVFAFKRRWRKAVSIVAAPIIALSFFGPLGRLGINRALIRLELSDYMAQIDALPTTDGPRLKFWQWGGAGGLMSPNVFWTLAYDESDQIALPRSAWSADWLRKADKVTQGSGSYSIIHPTSGSNLTLGALA
jgi:hypothetical protein